jgi:hypothetical protein
MLSSSNASVLQRGRFHNAINFREIAKARSGQIKLHRQRPRKKPDQLEKQNAAALRRADMQGSRFHRQAETITNRISGRRMRSI